MEQIFSGSDKAVKEFLATYERAPGIRLHVEFDRPLRDYEPGARVFAGTCEDVERYHRAGGTWRYID